MNQFKIWLNRNFLKIFVIGILVIVIYIMIRGLDDYYGYQKESKKEEILYEERMKNSSNYKNKKENNIGDVVENNLDDFPIMDKKSNEYQDIIFVIQKLLKTVYEANLNSDSIIVKSDVYNMFSNELIDYFTTGEKAVTMENIMDYIFKVENIDDFSIGNVYEYSNYNNVIRYEIMLRYKSNNQEPVDGYLIINMDYNNHTFSYDGFWKKTDDIDGDKVIESIDNKGSNTF